MADYVIKSSKIYTADGVFDGGVVIEGRKIKEIIADKDVIGGYEGKVIEAGDCPVIPGLIDIHIHGSAGWSVGGGTVEDIRGMVEYLPTRGVTSFQPSIGGGTLDIIKSSLKCIREVKESDYSGTRILGVHMEGPFLNPEKKGAFKVEYLIRPSLELMKEFIELSGNSVTHVALAPELEGADEVIDFLVKKGITVSGGHTNANVEQTKHAIERGVRLSNHTSNAQSPIHHREPGALGGYLLDDRVICELICDCFHVHPDMIRLIVKIKGTDRICMISDSIPAAGIEPGEYDFMGRTTFVDKEGWSRLPDGTIAGSTKDLLFGVKNMVQRIGYSMEEVIKMACCNPAKISGVSDCKGTIEAGKDADIVILNDNFDALYTFVEGELVHSPDIKKDYINEKIRAFKVRDL